MGYDAMANDASVPANARDFGKKKRANRSAKLKQCKLDARREQWLSQVKGKGCKVAPMAASPRSPPPLPISLARNGQGNTRGRHGDDDRELPGLHDSDFEPPTYSPTSSTSGNASRKDCSGSSTRSCSRSTSDAEDEGGRGEENGALDDWEAVADALSSGNDNDGGHRSCGTRVAVVEDSVPPAARNESRGAMKPEQPRPIPRAWRPDDVFRPQSLPNLMKQQSFPVGMERHYGVKAWGHPALSAPSSCPICYEDLDLTDSSFLPCSCGFRLCLFCHKRILEADGRCPGCRKQYSPMEGGQMDASGVGIPLISFRLSRSCSMSPKS